MKNKSKSSGIELTHIKRIIPFVSAYNNQPDSVQWDEDAIVAYVQQKDPSMKRHNDRVLRRFITTAISHLKAEQLDDSSDEELANDIHLMEVKDTNFMNRSLLGMYGQQTPEGTPPAISTEDDVTRTDTKTAPKKRAKPQESDSKKKVKGSKWETPSIKLSDVGGIDSIIAEIEELIDLPLKHPELYQYVGIFPPSGILLHGPPGCGKTMLAHAISGECGVPFINISAPSVVSGMSGESEKKLREVFEEARDLAPCILFIDEIDAITPKRETAQREMERRIVAQLLTCMDDVSPEKTGYKPVVIIGATNRPDALDPALRRAGRFDKEISIPVPNQEARLKILQKLAAKLRLSGDFDFESLAKVTPGYVGADLNALVSEAGMIAVKRMYQTLSNRNSMELDDPATDKPRTPFTNSDLESLCITNQDFLQALKKVQPSSKREGFATVPDVTWNDIGALSKVREELSLAIRDPIKYPDLFARVGVLRPTGVLLYGPPGCGKTLLAKATANDSHCNFISVKGPELLNKYVGESERAIRQVFQRAQSSSPCIIFFDELDALCPARSNDGDSQHSSRLVNTLLTEMDGMGTRKDVYVIAATNRPDMIDPAMLRPGRLDKCLYVDLPTCSERIEILRTCSRNLPLAQDVDFTILSKDERCDGFSGADIASLVREAGVAALRTCLQVDHNGITNPGIKPEEIFVQHRHFDMAFSKVSPSVGKKDRKRYELLKVKFGSEKSTDN